MIFFFSFLIDEESAIAFQEKPLSLYRIHDSWSQVKPGANTEDFLRKSKSVAIEGIEGYEKFIKIANTHSMNPRVIALIELLNLNKTAWNAQLKLTEGNKCTPEEIFTLIKSGIYRRDLNILFSIPLAISSFLCPSIASKIFRFGLVMKQYS